jgi:hypothetical protein
MPINYPGTFETRIRYITNEPAGVNDHELRLSMEMSIEGSPGDPFSDWIPVQKNGSAVDSLDQHVDALVAFLRPFYHTSVDFVSAELWEYAPGSFDSIFRSSYDITLSGTATFATVNHSQSILTMRSQLGGIGKVDLRGTFFGAAPASGYPTAIVPVDNLLAHMIAGTSIYVARDGGYFMSGLLWLPGINEQSFKRINR